MPCFSPHFCSFSAKSSPLSLSTGYFLFYYKIMIFNNLWDPDIYYNFDKIDSYGKNENYIISPREDGKSTAVFFFKVLKGFIENGLPCLYLRRNKTDLSSLYLDSFSMYIDKFLEDASDYNITYHITERINGVVPIYLNGKSFIDVVCLSTKIGSKKSLVKRYNYMIFDEFIVNPLFGEHYLKMELTRYLEIKKTFMRENIAKTYFIGNPYTLYNPYFVGYNVDTTKLKKNSVYVDNVNNIAIERHALHPILKEKILARDPKHDFGLDAYDRYSVEGEAVNDEPLKVSKYIPNNYVLTDILRYQGKYFGIFKNKNLVTDYTYAVKVLPEGSISSSRKIYAFDFQELYNNVVLITRSERARFAYFKNAVRSRSVIYDSLESAYVTQEIYGLL